MNDVEQAEKVIRDLEEKHESLIGRTKVLCKQRQEVAYAAHTGDKTARARLNAINAEASTHGGEIESVVAALVEAKARLNTALAGEASVADRAQALLLKGAIAEYVEEANELDASLEDMAFHANAMNNALNRIHQLGGKIPTSEQNRVLGAHCFKSALMKTAWKKELEFEHIPTFKFQSFKKLVSGWVDTLMRDVERRLGDEKDRAA
jgi:hypothetical protein